MPLVDVARFVHRLVNETGVEYVVIGGVAVSARAEPRATRDVDLVLQIGTDEVEGFLGEIEKRGLAISRRPEVLEKLVDGKPAKIVWDRRFSFDLRVAGYTIDEMALVRSDEKVLSRLGLSFNVATAEDLIVYKIARMEDIDRADIKNIMTHVPALDWDYIREQASVLAREYRPEVLARLAEVEAWRKP